MSNQPKFDPLSPNLTEQERDEMFNGYMDGTQGRKPPLISSIAYDYGRRNGANDRAGVADDEQRAIARQIVLGWAYEGATRH